MAERIREATVDDVEGIRGVATATWHATYDAVIGAETVDEVVDSWYDPTVLETQVREDGVFLVATRDETVVGFVHAGPHETDPALHVCWRLYVHPDVWREGLGRTLLSAVIERLAGTRERLTLDVLADNDRGRAFYESMGFECVDRKPTTLAGEPVVECRYERPLPS